MHVNREIHLVEGALEWTTASARAMVQVMRLAANIAAGLLGFIFVVLSSLILLRLLPIPPPPPGSPAESFTTAMGPTGYMHVVQVLEIIGGILVAIPKTRNWGLLILGPIVINIFLFHVLIAKAGLIGPPLLVILLAAFLLFAEREKFAGLLK